ncbi:MAG: type II toxin-antitoxin system RelE/ParE family toxin [Lachnospiraceae bacterium]|nr:type II toxin-antitoxin system RelE/ParE family toxin [Lachnospiraceae bacterium]
MDYNVVLTNRASADLENIISYLIHEKNSEQAATNILDDFDETMDILGNYAGTLKYCDNPKLKAKGYKRINFRRHKYFMMFRVEDTTVYVDRIYHFLQDYESRAN